ncbi:gluconokinase [Magnetospira thiophila]
MAVSQFHFDNRPIVIVMGVSGSGKSTVGKALADELGLPFLDADDFHPEANVKKMSRGIPLTDEDRWPWLRALSRAMRKAAGDSGGVIATCSALKRTYRNYLRDNVGHPLVLVLLDGDRETIHARMRARADHYMPPSLLSSQLADLERPESDEPSVTVSIDNQVDTIVATLVARLREEDR